MGERDVLEKNFKFFLKTRVGDWKLHLLRTCVELGLSPWALHIPSFCSISLLTIRNDAVKLASGTVKV